MRMIAAAALLLAGPAVAQQADWNAATPVEIGLSSFRFTPDVVNLRRNVVYRLRLTNSASGGHNLVAREFFAAATIAPDDRAKVAGGRIELAAGASADIRLKLSSAGSYPMHCSHFGHSAFGMTGRINVI